jgi:hypothetical protein
MLKEKLGSVVSEYYGNVRVGEPHYAGLRRKIRGWGFILLLCEAEEGGGPTQYGSLVGGYASLEGCFFRVG